MAVRICDELTEVPDPIVLFSDRLYNEWLPSFCDARRGRNYCVEGFRKESIDRLNAFDATWFMRAVDSGVVTHNAGFFRAPQSRAQEQLFWSGSKDRVPRPLTLWIEPIIAIGAVARLHEEFSWPTEYLGMQSGSDWAFDIVGYSPDQGKEQLVVEVKKTDDERRTLVALMSAYANEEPMQTEPSSGRERNAYRKVVHIRAKWPGIFWALGPQGKGQVFQVQRGSDLSEFELAPIGDRGLTFTKGETRN